MTDSLYQKSKSYFFKIGDLSIELSCPEFKISDHLLPFVTDAQAPDMRFDIRFGENISLPVGKNLHDDTYESFYEDVRIIYNEKSPGILVKDTYKNNIHDVVFDSRFKEFYGYNAIIHILDLPRKVIDFEGIFLHASYVLSNGKALLFTAPKQTGKSTQAALWNEHRNAEIVNGDRALLRKVNGRWYAFGSPYCGTSDICRNIAAPIGGIVMISQAPENTARKATAHEALVSLLDGCSYDTWDRAAVSKVMDITQDLIRSVSFYKLSCTKDVRAVETLEAML